jgi:AcrR family transcriptional regulator
MSRPSTELRRAILDQARRALVEGGFNGLSLRPIARAVGCTATSIYLYFHNKDALIHALIDEGMEMLHAALAKAVEGVEEPRERLERLARAYLAFGLENPEYYEIMFMLHPERMERYPADRYRRARSNLEMFHHELDAALGPPGAAGRDTKTESTLIWTSLHGTVSLLIARRVDVSIDREALCESAVQQALRTLLPSTGTASLPPIRDVASS